MKTLIVLGILALIVLFLIAQYNKLIRLNIAVDEAWAQIEVQLKRRSDLIPNLVETVKGYATHEKTTFDAVITARAKATTASTVADARYNAALKASVAPDARMGAVPKL